MINKKMSFLLAGFLALIMSFAPIAETYAAGWGPVWISEGGHWGSSECTTSYPRIKFTTYMDAGQGLVSVQRLSGSTWTTVSGPHLLDVPDLNTHYLSITTSVASSSTKYRVYVEAPRERSHVTKVTCQGVN
ncbi:MAG: hypothetical protein WB502_05890 [Thermoactinomyces sp.]